MGVGECGLNMNFIAVTCLDAEPHTLNHTERCYLDSVAPAK
jgi:hypothetical protein